MKEITINSTPKQAVNLVINNSMPLSFTTPNKRSFAELII